MIPRSLRSMAGLALTAALTATSTVACTVDASIDAVAVDDGTRATATATPTAPAAEPVATPTPAAVDEAPTATATPTPGLERLEFGTDGVGDPYYPDLGNGGYQVERYVIDLDWDPVAAELDGTATLEAVATIDLASFNVDLQGMTIDAVTVDGIDATFTRDASEVRVLTPAGIAEGTPFVAAFAYSGRPGPVPPISGFDAGGWTTLDNIAYVAGEPASGMSWHPTNEHPTDVADYRIEMTVPTGLVVVTNGTPVDEIDEGDGTTTFISESTSPRPSYLTTLAIGDLVAVELAPAGDIALRSWFERSLVDSAELFEDLAAMIDVLDDVFGPYPFDSYGVLVIDADLGFALETQTLSIFGNDFLRGGSLDHVVVHELAHQWFGDHIRLAEWDEIWLNEGFASYAELLYFEATDPGFDIDAQAARWAAAGPGGWGPPGDPGAAELFDASVYLRGALTLHALRRTIGDEAFFVLLRTWVERYGGQAVTSDDFIALAEEVSGTALADFFDAWLYQDEQPALPD